MALSQLTNYLEDDWNDNALTSRTGSTEGYFLHPSDSLTGAGDYEAGDALKGVYRPDWNVTVGTIDTSNGYVDFQNTSGDSFISTPSEFLVGSWEFDWRKSATFSSGNTSVNFFFMAQNNDSVASSYTYKLYFGQSNRNAAIDKYDASNNRTELIGWIQARDENYHDARVTRDSNGNFEAFEDGVSQGTANDTTFKSVSYITLAGGGGDVDMHMDNLVVN